MAFTFALSALAGVLTVLAPCVLPLLPVIVGGSVTGRGRWRPYVVAGSLVVSLIVFTLALKASTLFINVPPRVWTLLSGIAVIGIGVAMLAPNLWDRAMGALGMDRSKELLREANRGDGLGSAILTGVALGPVFSSCSPTYAWVIATILPVSWTEGVVALAIYCTTLAATLLAVSLAGRKILSRFAWARDPRGAFQRGVAVAMIVVGVAVATGLDARFQVWAAEHIPSLTSVESHAIRAAGDKDAPEPTEAAALSKGPKAPDFTGITEWINSEPLSLDKLRGKVVLVDFWTYSCINCIRTQPYLNAWWDRYKDDGLVIVGVHAPEFAFEKKVENVREGVDKAHITYPVALDNEFGTWRAYKNLYWPAKYLIDKDGIIRDSHFGEGGYDEMEDHIRSLLGVDGPRARVTEPVETGQAAQSPETYLGTARAEGFVASPYLHDGTDTYTTSGTPRQSGWGLDGSFTVDHESVQAGEDGATLTYTFAGKRMFLVLDGPRGAKVRVGIAGKDHAAYGKDAPGGVVTLDGTRLYRLVELPDVADSTTVTLTFDKGVKAHAFTFG